MSQELTPLQRKIRSFLITFTRKEPYISNTAIRISLFMTDDLQAVSRGDLPARLKQAYRKGYAAGYAAKKRDSVPKQK